MSRKDKETLVAYYKKHRAKTAELPKEHPFHDASEVVRNDCFRRARV